MEQQNQSIRNEALLENPQFMADMGGNSYDNAVKEFKWLHEVNQEGLDRVLEEDDMKTPAATMHNQEEAWLMKPFAWTQRSNQIQL
jgi:hypothetical protein